MLIWSLCNWISRVWNVRFEFYCVIINAALVKFDQDLLLHASAKTRLQQEWRGLENATINKESVSKAGFLQGFKNNLY